MQIKNGAPSGPAVVVKDVSKMFRIYHERNQSIKATLMRGRRARYDEFWALKDVNLEIASGQTFGLVGSNGSGKSTLLKTMARILSPDSGSIVTNGKVTALLELGAGFHPELSGRDNVYLNGSILGLSQKEIDSKFDEIVDFAGLEQFIDQPVKNYSSGMYVRLGFAVAINVDPDILMVDEVLAVGDEEFQTRCMEKFDEFAQAGKTIILVSHALGTVRDMCDQVAWLSHGRILEVGDPDEVIDKYQSRSHDKITTQETSERLGGPVQIDSCRMIVDGSPTKTVRTGDMVRFRIAYTSTQDMEDEVAVSFQLRAHTGQPLSAPNTHNSGLGFRPRTGQGVLELEVPRLLLLPGQYDVGIAVHLAGTPQRFDYKPNALHFKVLQGSPFDGAGYFTLEGRWASNS
jgi:ABC transporter related